MLLLALTLLVLSIFSSPASSATTVSKALRFTVVKRTTTLVVVRRGPVRLTLRHGESYVRVRDVRRFRVLKRARDYCLLMPLISATSCGAVGNGDVDDTSAIAETMHAAARSAKGVYVPPGVYRMDSPVTVPDGLAVYGAGKSQSWLQGSLRFGSNSAFTDLKIGPASAGLPSVRNVDGATATSFSRCRFRGGGSGNSVPNVLIGAGRDASRLTFRRCEIERTLGSGWNNTVSIVAAGNTVNRVTWEGCRFGVSNGVATGASAMMVEAWTNRSLQDWWRNLTFRDCEFEATENWCLDFACYTDSGRGTGVLVDGCTFNGSGFGSSGGQGVAICLEWPDEVIIRNNYFKRCEEGAIFSAGDHMGANTDTHWRITGNTFDWDTAERGIIQRFAPISLASNHNVVTGNTFIAHTDIPLWSSGQGACVVLWGYWGEAHSNIITGNRFYVNRTQRAIMAINGASEAKNTIRPNTVVRQ